MPLLPSVKSALAKLATENPFGWDKERFIFYGTLPEKPVVENVLVEGFKDALARAGVSEAERKERRLPQRVMDRERGTAARPGEEVQFVAHDDFWRIDVEEGMAHHSLLNAV